MRADEHGNASGCRHHLTQEFQPLGHQLSRENIVPVRLLPGLARLATRPSLTGSSPTLKTMGIVVVAALAATAAAISNCCDHGDLASNQFGRQRGQPIELTLRPAVLDRYVLALDVAAVL